MSDDFFIPTGEELERGEVPRKPRKRGPLQRYRELRAARQIDLEVPETVGRRKKVRQPGAQAGDDLLDTGSTGRVVRSVEATAAGVDAQRELIIPPELREKYGLDD